MAFISHKEVLQAIAAVQNDTEFQQAVSNIKPGTFVRNPENQDYQDRIIYTSVLRDFVYNPAVLNVIFGDQELKEQFFRAFGYQGEVDFTIYPKCWLRDLPLLDLGKKLYLGDDILLGTNQVTPDQEKLVVGPIKIGDYCVFNQGCAIGGKNGHRSTWIVWF